MSKETLVFQGPVFTRSGYGDHCRDLLKSLKSMDRFDIKIVPLRWGNTPQNQADPSTEFGQWMLQRVVTQLTQKPDVFIQVSVANEFQPIGEYNIGITAGVETTIVPKEFIEGSNKMDLIIVPSNFTKTSLVGTVYQQKNKDTQQVVHEDKLQKPVEVLFEGVDLDVYDNFENDVDILEGVETDFNYLIVGHWLKGNLGQDRKDLGMAIKTFATVFKDIPKKDQPGLVLKISSAGFSVMDRENMLKKVEAITETFGDNCPPIYLLHGDLSDNNMAQLYNHPKIKSMISFTKGEGYGRPLAEFALTDKPILVSNWSGHKDFLEEEHTVFLEGELRNVDESASDKFLMKESQWFTVNYTKAANSIFDVYKNYDKHLKKSKGLRANIIDNFSIDKMSEVFTHIIETHVKAKPKVVPFKLPKLEKIK